MYSGVSVSPLASRLLILASLSWSIAGMSTVRAYSLYAGMLDIMFETTRPFRCCWYLSAYSVARIPPHECPRRKKLPRVEAEGDAYLLDLVDEPVDLPEIGFVGLVAVERSELIVVVVLDTGAGR